MESAGGAPDRSTGPKPCLLLLLLTHLPGGSKTTQNQWVALPPLACSCLGLDGKVPVLWPCSELLFICLGASASWKLSEENEERIWFSERQWDENLRVGLHAHTSVRVRRGAEAFSTDGPCRGRT